MLLSFMSGCDRENVGELRRELEELEKQLKVLQSWQEKVNENLKTLQKLLEGLNQGKYVTSVMETSAGCTIILDQEFVLQIRNGEKGEDGRSVGIVTPSVSVYDSLDGHMYWTIGGILVKNDQGECIRVDGESGEQGGIGEQGEMGMTPQLRIQEQTNEWEVSWDGGVTWSGLGMKATGPKGEQGEQGERGEQGEQGVQGPKGDPVFVEGGVVVEEEYVEFTLADALQTKFRLPRYRTMSLEFPQGKSFRLPRCVEKDILFTLSGGNEKVKMNVLEYGGCRAQVVMTEGKKNEGIIRTQSAEEQGEGAIVILLTEDEGRCWSYRLNITTLPTPKMIRIPGGSLDIIGPHGKGWELTEFWMSETEITEQQYCDFLNDEGIIRINDIPTIGRGDTVWCIWYYHDPVYENGKWSSRMGDVIGEQGMIQKDFGDYPVEGVKWAGAKAYCRWAGGSLPTEAQWEYAARGGAQNPKAGTEIYAGGDNVNEVAWWRENRQTPGAKYRNNLVGGSVHPVKTKMPNFLGLYDMSGNIAEWCEDWYGEEYPVRGRKNRVDPQGPETGSAKVIRGGGWVNCLEWHHAWPETVDHLEVNSRCWWPVPDEGTSSEEGFRLVYMK